MRFWSVRRPVQGITHAPAGLSLCSRSTARDSSKQWVEALLSAREGASQSGSFIEKQKIEDEVDKARRV
jgi:hypothetical protein